MTTIPRHPVPADSYDAKRPLNDLLIAQFEHFKHCAESLPPQMRANLPPVPSVDDSYAVGNFIAAVTRLHIGLKKELPRIVPKPIRKKLPGTLSLAAVADDTLARPKKSSEKTGKKQTPNKSQSTKKQKPQTTKKKQSAPTPRSPKKKSAGTSRSRRKA